MDSRPERDICWWCAVSSQQFTAERTSSRATRESQAEDWREVEKSRAEDEWGPAENICKQKRLTRHNRVSRILNVPGKKNSRCARVLLSKLPSNCARQAQ